MAKFHDSGTICKARLRSCPLGLSSDEHIIADSVSEFEEKLATKMEQQMDALSSVSRTDGQSAHSFTPVENNEEAEKLYRLLGNATGDNLVSLSFDQTNGFYTLLTTLEKIDPSASKSLRLTLKDRAANERPLWNEFKEKDAAHSKVMREKVKLLQRGSMSADEEADIETRLFDAESAENEARDRWHLNRRNHALAKIADFSRSWKP